VLGVLVEKQHTVPDTYPLSLNALQSGCNQKTARAPVMEVSEADLLVAVDSLKHLHLIFEVSGSRVARYEHNLGRVLASRSRSTLLTGAGRKRRPSCARERLHSLPTFVGRGFSTSWPRASRRRQAAARPGRASSAGRTAVRAGRPVAPDAGPDNSRRGEPAALKVEQRALAGIDAPLVRTASCASRRAASTPCSRPPVDALEIPTGRS
jgi:hypothetical protein